MRQKHLGRARVIHTTLHEDLYRKLLRAFPSPGRPSRLRYGAIAEILARCVALETASQSDAEANLETAIEVALRAEGTEKRVAQELAYRWSVFLRNEAQKAALKAALDLGTGEMTEAHWKQERERSQHDD